MGVPTPAFKIVGCPVCLARVRSSPVPTPDPKRPRPPSFASLEFPVAVPSPGARRAACYVIPAPRRQTGPLLRLLRPEPAPFSGRFVKSLVPNRYSAAGRNPRPSVLPEPTQTQPSLPCPRTWHPAAGRPPGLLAAAAKAPIRTVISRPRSASATSLRPKVSLPGCDPRLCGVELHAFTLLLGGHGSFFVPLDDRLLSVLQ